jgi:galactokinase
VAVTQAPASATTVVLRDFAARFGSDPDSIVRAPGRVNLIGEHTDYNDGYVLPLAIDPAIWIALRARSDRRVRAWSVDFRETVEFDVDELSPNAGQTHGWGDYVKGVAWALRRAGHTLNGWDGAILGEVPIGAGLSSSAALEVATARAFADVSALPWDPAAMAQIAQRAENQWVGLQCGIMDQLASTAGQRDHAILIDCRSLALQPIAIPDGLRVVVLDTTTRRDLTSSAYNERRRECEAAARAYGVTSLRDVRPAQLATRPPGISDVAFRRARHVVTENARVLQMTSALPEGDLRRVAALMTESHQSLRDDFEVSSPALDAIVAAAQRAGSVGARMTGAGFGGCAVALVKTSRAEVFVTHVLEDYRKSTGTTGRAYVWSAGAGASSRKWIRRIR